MKTITFMIFLSIIFVFSHNQVLKESLPLNNPRKLVENANETILLGYENYNFTSPYDFVYFDTLFYLKNWDLDNIEIMAYSENNSFTIDAEVIYEKSNETTKFTCINNVTWFILQNYNNYYYPNVNCSKYGYCIAKYRCELNITGKGIPRKINITTNFTNKDINLAKISYVSSSAGSLERDLVSLKYETEDFLILKNANFTSQSPNSFKIKGKILIGKYYYDDSDDIRYDSENIYLITTVNGSPKKIPCSGKQKKDSSDDNWYYNLDSKGSNNLAGANLSYALLNYTTSSNEKLMAILDFSENSKNANGTILPPKVDYKKNSGGLSTGGIVAIVIPTVIVLLGVGALVFYLSRRAVPSPPPIKNIGNNTMGVVASSEAVVHQ